MPRHYEPFTYKFKKIPLIIYPVKDENPLDVIFNPMDHKSIQEHLDNLYTENNEVLSKGDYHILFVWQLKGKRMTDVWIHFMKNWSNSGPLVECLIFSEMERSFDAGIASGDSLIVLGREEELRRNSGSIEEYINRVNQLPEFPEGMLPKESFYK